LPSVPNMRLPIRLLILLSCILPGLVPAQDEITTEAIVARMERSQKPIAIRSSNAGWEALAKRAFATHGGFRLAKGEHPDFTIVLKPVGSSGCQLVIESGKPSRQLFEATVNAPDARQACLRACDLAVRKTLGIPGYFAGQLAFVGDRTGNREIWTSDLFFQSARQVTNDSSKSVSPHWSPDGRKLLYTGYYKSGFPDVFEVDLSTGRRSLFASYKGTNTGGAFSPDGQRVALILSSSGNPELYVAMADGKRPQQLTRGRAVEASPAWSPDGRQIVYTSDSLGGPQLYIISATGGSPQHLSTRLSGYVDEPDWNPRDPAKILFTAATRSGYQIGLIDLQSQRANWITNSGDNSEAVWLNDGRHIIYVQRRGKWSGLRLRDTETGKDTALHSDNFGNAYQPAFVYPN